MAVVGNRGDIVGRALADATFDPGFGDNEAIRLACQLGGRHAIVKLLLAHRGVDPAACDNEALRMAAAKGDMWTVEALLESGRVDPGARESEALRKLVAAESVANRAALVERLLAFPAVDPSAKDNEAIVAAPRTSNVLVLRRLLADPRVDPAARDNEPLLASIHLRNYGAFTELLADERVDPFARDLEALRLIIQVQHRADFLKAFFRQPRVLRHPGFRTALDRAMALTMGASTELTMEEAAKSIARAFLSLRYHRTLMEWAVKAGMRQMVDLLLSDKRVDASEFLSLAATMGKAWIVQRCLQHPRIALGHYYTQAVEGAARNGHRDIVQMLEEHRARIVAFEGPAQICGAHPSLSTSTLPDYAPFVLPTSSSYGPHAHRPAPGLVLPTFNPASLPPLPPVPMFSASAMAGHASSSDLLPRPREQMTPCPSPPSSLLVPLPPTPMLNPRPFSAAQGAPVHPQAMHAQQPSAAPFQIPPTQQPRTQLQSIVVGRMLGVESAKAEPGKAKRAPRRKAVSRKGDSKQEAPEADPEPSPSRPVQLPRFSDLFPHLASRKRKAADGSPVPAPVQRAPRAISVQARVEQLAKRRRLEEAPLRPDVAAQVSAAMEVDSQAPRQGSAFDYLVFAAGEAASDPADRK
jgi:hypothetical protein